METKSKSKPSELLMDVIGFDETDLEANRSGQLSDRQLSQWENTLKKLKLWQYLAVILGLLFTVIILNRTAKPIFYFIFSTAATLSLLVVLRSQIPPLQKDYEADFVPSVEGRIRLDISEGKNQSYKLYIQEQKFEVSKAVFLAFKNGDPYIIYYTPHTKKILSVEWLRD